MEDEYTQYSDSISKIRDEIFTPIDEAVSQVTERRNDPDLHSKVLAILNNDKPKHFSGDTPIFYLSRFVATPNFEFFRAAEMTQAYGLPLIVGEDLKSTFVSSNELKLKLGKLSVITGKNARGDETFENITVIDFAKAQGTSICDNQTIKNQSLCDFHHTLFEEFANSKAENIDESDWVDRNHRDDIRAQYEKLLALLCRDGIMLESFPPDEHDFLEEIVHPAFIAIKEATGVTPLIVEHISDEEEVEKDWNAYPQECYTRINELID